MQRWMESKMQLAKRHGITISKARHMGPVFEDRPVGYVEPKILPAPKENKAGSVCRKAKRPVAWGSKKAARALMRPMPEITFTAQSRVIITK
jgi:hypothetical protein